MTHKDSLLLLKRRVLMDGQGQKLKYPFICEKIQFVDRNVMKVLLTSRKKEGHAANKAEQLTFSTDEHMRSVLSFILVVPFWAICTQDWCCKVALLMLHAGTGTFRRETSVVGVVLSTLDADMEHWGAHEWLLPEQGSVVTEQDADQSYASCCSKMLMDVIPIPSAKMVADAVTAELAVSKGSSDISCCESCASNSPSVCDVTLDKLVAVPNKRRKECFGSNLSDEQVLVLVAHHANWNPPLLCFLSCVCKKMNAISNRILWREFCLSRAPKMVSDLLLGAKDGRIDGGWHALGKLFLYCEGCSHSSESSSFSMSKIAGHFVSRTRFSRTTGQSFILPWCRTDVLYMSDPCEHVNNPEDVGLFRGVFKAFDKSKTKKLIVNMRVHLEEEEKCPFCKAGVWSMSRARMVPRSASNRLAAFDGDVEYFICLNGHVSGRCALLHLSDTDTSDADYGCYGICGCCAKFPEPASTVFFPKLQCWAPFVRSLSCGTIAKFFLALPGLRVQQNYQIVDAALVRMPQKGLLRIFSGGLLRIVSRL